MFPAAKIAKKFLMYEPFKVDGFEYQFISVEPHDCLLYTSPSPRDRQKSRMPSSA